MDDHGACISRFNQHALRACACRHLLKGIFSPYNLLTIDVNKGLEEIKFPVSLYARARYILILPPNKRTMK